ncbi:auxin-responsive protein IAA3-like, partial [Phalaenopsis equestris]
MKPLLEHYYMGVHEVAPNGGAVKPLPSSSVDGGVADVKGEDIGLNLKETELRLGLPGSDSPGPMDSIGLSLGIQMGFVAGAKSVFTAATDGAVLLGLSCGSRTDREKLCWPMAEDVGPVGNPVEKENNAVDRAILNAAKAQVVGWPPIKNYRKNTMAINPAKNKEEGEGKAGMRCLFVKVSMDGAPYMRKVDLRTYSNYEELSLELGTMFCSFTI